jgi:hypothetical protein
VAAPFACGDNLETEALAAATQLETDYNEGRLQHLIIKRGRICDQGRDDL